jgi:hypothetical protein
MQNEPFVLPTKTLTIKSDRTRKKSVPAGGSKAMRCRML